MRYFFFTMIEALELILRRYGYDVFTELDDTGRGFLAFSREHSPDCREYWGLGLHVMVCPLRVAPQTA